MTQSWEKHIEKVEDLPETHGTDAKQQYFEDVYETVLDRFDEEFERYEETNGDDLDPEEMLEISKENAVYLMDEMAESAEAEAYTGIFRDLEKVISNSYTVEHYTSALRDMKQEEQQRSEQNLREVDNYETLDVPENMVVEVIEQDLDPVLEDII